MRIADALARSAVRGLGGALVAAEEDRARARGSTEMASDCVLENTVSFMAHSSLGYREVERWIHFRKPPAGGD
jgi:hypothetical protein